MMETILLADNYTYKSKTKEVEHKELQLSTGSYVTITRAKAPEKTALLRHFKNDRRSVGLHFCMNAQTVFTQNDKVPPAKFGGEKCNLMLLQPHDTLQQVNFSGDMLMTSFYIEFENFQNILGEAFEALPAKFLKAALGKSCSCNYYRWQPATYSAISQMANAQSPTPATRLFFESKMLELTAILLQSQECDSIAGIKIKRTEEEKIRYACEILLQNLENPPSLSALASRATTNEFTLKKGFKEIYGKPVYQYLAQKRMERAFDLLQTSDQTIAAVALSVGYEDPSAFTRAFSRHFNMLPANVKRRSFTA
jgi:AraC-like DNA-binding protein